MKLKFYLPLLVLMFSATAMNANAAPKTPNADTAVGMTQEQKVTRIEQIKERVKEIRNMDISQLSREERKDLREELKSMNKESKSLGNGGIYISLAGIVIIILILILILR